MTSKGIGKKGPRASFSGADVFRVWYNSVETARVRAKCLMRVFMSDKINSNDVYLRITIDTLNFFSFLSINVRNFFFFFFVYLETNFRFPIPGYNYDLRNIRNYIYI